MNSPLSQRTAPDSSLGSAAAITPVGLSDAQVFGPLAIYSHQQRAKRLAEDLAEAFFPEEFFNRKADDPPLLNILLVSRDGSTEDEDAADGAENTDGRTRFYHPSYLGRFGFPGATENSQLESVLGWIKKSWDLDDSLKEETSWECFVKEVHSHGDAEWRKWREMHPPEEAFDLLVAAFSHLEYSGVLPTELDHRFPLRERFETRPCYPIFHIIDSKIKPQPWFKGACVDLYDKARDWTPEENIPVGDPVFLKLGEADETKIRPLFCDFLDPFFLGKKQREDKSDQTSFKGYALPLFDRWTSGGPLGAFVGWIFLSFSDKMLKTKFSKRLTGANKPLRRTYREILRANLNDFADALAEHVLEEELTAYSPATHRTPREYFIKRFHHIEGWKVKQTSCADLAPGHFFKPKTGQEGIVESLTVRLGETTCVTLIPKHDTLRPRVSNIEKLTPRARDYFVRLTAWARTFWEGLKHLELQAKEGRKLAADEAYSKTAHQLRKLAEGIHKDNSKENLDTLRRYFTLTFLSPKNVTGRELTRLATDIYGGGSFGEHFLMGNTFSDFISSSFEYSRRLYPLMLGLHNRSAITGALPMRRLSFAPPQSFEREVWCHEAFVEGIATHHAFIVSDEDRRRLQIKLFYFAALTALWQNIIEHSVPDSEIRLVVEDNQLIVLNDALPAVKENETQDRSRGTEQTLNYYFNNCFPENVLKGEVVFPSSPTGNMFRTAIPLPEQLYA